MERVLHGVFMVIHHLGVLLVGPPGSGKSRLGLELVSRGHALVADDCALFEATVQGLVGASPAHTGDFLHVRGLGVFDIRRQYGDEALCPRHPLQLIMALDPAATGTGDLALGPPLATQMYLGVAVPVLRVAPEWPGPAVVEALVMRQRQAFGGYDAAVHFVRCQDKVRDAT